MRERTGDWAAEGLFDADTTPLRFEPLETRVLLSGVDAMWAAQAAQLAASLTTTGALSPIYIADEEVVAQDQPGEPGYSSLPSVIDLDDFRADGRFSGIDGSGGAVVVLDTGVDLDHPYFGPDLDTNGVADRIVYHYDFADGDADATDVDNHGSNVTSIIGSEHGTYTGVAPGVDLIHLKVFEDGGAGYFSYIENALQWVVANAATYDIVAVNMSLSDSQNHSSAAARYGLGDELAALAALDIVVTSASGNSFYSFSSVQGAGYPSSDPNSLSIGAVYENGSSSGYVYGSGAQAYSSGFDRVTPFSQRHASLTTVLAPGAPLYGASANGGTVSMHGTSQASPVVAGMVALAQQLAQQELGRKLTLAEFTAMLIASGDTVTDGDDEDDNVTNTGLDFQRANMFALGELILSMAAGNNAPTLTTVSDFGPAVAGRAFAFDYDDLLAASDAADADADDISFRFESVESGTLTVNGVAVNPGVTMLASGDTAVWTPSAAASGTATAATLVAYDGQVDSSLAVDLDLSIDRAPTIDAEIDLGMITYLQTVELSYAELLSLSGAADADGDDIEFRFDNVAEASSLTIDGVEVVPGVTTLAAGQTLVFTPATTLQRGRGAAFTVEAFDGVAASGQPADAIVTINESPSLTSIDALTGAMPGETFRIRHDTLLARTNATDPEGESLRFLITAVLSGQLTLNGVPVVPGVTMLSANQTLVWTPPQGALGQVNAFSILADDGFSRSVTGVTVPIVVNTAPSLAASAIAGEAFAGVRSRVLATDLFPSLSASDADGDDVSLRIVSIERGILTINGEAATVGQLIDADDVVDWRPDAGDSGTLTAFTVVATDGMTDSNDTAAVRFDVDLNSPLTNSRYYFADITDAATVSSRSDGRLTVTTLNEAGLPIVYERDAEGRWTTVDLAGALADASTSGSLITWVDAKDDRPRGAVVTTDGLVLFERQPDGSWAARNLSLDTGVAATLDGSLVTFTSIDGLVSLAGLSSSGDLIVFQQTGAIDADGRFVWTAANLSQRDLEPAGLETPDFQGDLVAYVTGWNALTIAGIDTSGDIQAVWIVPGMAAWTVNNLSEIADAPALVGGLTAFVSPWHSLHIGGIDQSGRLQFTWWAPGMAGTWLVSDLSASVAPDGGAPLLDAVTISSFVTPWGGLNIVGADEDGLLTAFWWAPGMDAWQASTLVTDDALAPVSPLRGASTPGGELSIVGSIEDGRVARYFWSPGADWTVELLTAAA